MLAPGARASYMCHSYVKNGLLASLAHFILLGFLMAQPFPANSASPANAQVALSESAKLADGPAISDFRLDNGLSVVVIPDHRSPVVTHMVWYRNGSADDPPGKSGIAHFLEHLMFKGTTTHPKGEFSEVIAELGGQENAFTGNDYTAYFQRVAREHLPVMMAFEADRMTGLTLTDEIVAPERDVVLEERRMHCDADPGAQLNEAVQAALFTHHPYGTPVIGWGHEIEGLNKSDALAYYQRFYTPENAILIVAGDVDAEDVRRQAEATYGKINPRGAAARSPRQWRAAWCSSMMKRSISQAGSVAISRLRRAPPNQASPRRSKCWRICWEAARPACFIAR
jgi:zinc protease